MTVRGIELVGSLRIPAGARELVLFGNGGESSRRSPGNLSVAHTLEARGLATLLVDLLSTDEERVDAIDARHRFDAELLAGRLIDVTDWVDRHGALASFPLGYFGGSTGAAAVLIAAAARPARIVAVVCRGGQPDLAERALASVHAPTLLIVGGEDHEVLGLDRRAREKLRCASELAVIPGATHDFEEPGALERVAELAGDWFLDHLRPPEKAAQPAT